MTIQSISQAENNIMKCKELCSRAGVRFSNYSLTLEPSLLKIIKAIDCNSNNEEIKLWTKKHRVSTGASKITINYETDDDEIEYMSDETISQKLSKPALKFEDVCTKKHNIEYIDDDTCEVKTYTTNSLRIETPVETKIDLQSHKTDTSNIKIIQHSDSDYINIQTSEINENYTNHSDDESSPLINRKGFQFSNS